MTGSDVIGSLDRGSGTLLSAHAATDALARIDLSNTVFHRDRILGTNRRTIAVLACGLDVDYPTGSGPMKRAILNGGGLVSMIGVENISVSRISHANQRFVPGQKAMAAVLRKEPGRICLTHRELLGTWEQNAALFTPGQAVVFYD